MLQGWTEPNSFHVCITSYKQLFRGYTALARVRWRCLVIDEMQCVKGLSEQHWEAVFTLQRSACPGPWGVGAEGSVTQTALSSPSLGDTKGCLSHAVRSPGRSDP